MQLLMSPENYRIAKIGLTGDRPLQREFSSVNSMSYPQYYLDTIRIVNDMNALRMNALYALYYYTIELNYYRALTICSV